MIAIFYCNGTGECKRMRRFNQMFVSTMLRKHETEVRESWSHFLACTSYNIEDSSKICTQVKRHYYNATMREREVYTFHYHRLGICYARSLKNLSKSTTAIHFHTQTRFNCNKSLRASLAQNALRISRTQYISRELINSPSKTRLISWQTRPRLRSLETRKLRP